MIIYGKNGTLCLYYKGLLISSYPLTNKKLCNQKALQLDYK